jgi:hypothetical protein
MNRLAFLLIFPLLLTGCIGSFFSGQTEYLSEQYPDIRTVPVRKEAVAPRGLHEGEEQASRNADLKNLEQDWKKIHARDKALREGAFPAKTGEN